MNVQTLRFSRQIGCIVLMFVFHFTVAMPALSRQLSASSSSTSKFVGTWNGRWAENLVQRTPGVATIQTGSITLKVSLYGKVSGFLSNDALGVVGTLAGRSDNSGTLIFQYTYPGSTEVYIARCVLSRPDAGRSAGNMTCFYGRQALSLGKISLVKAANGTSQPSAIAPSTPYSNRSPQSRFDPLPSSGSGRRLCPKCNGTGKIDKCITCKGTGDANAPGREFQDPYQDGYVRLPYIECQNCHGSGRTCFRCSGTGYISH